MFSALRYNNLRSNYERHKNLLISIQKTLSRVRTHRPAIKNILVFRTVNIQYSYSYIFNYSEIKIIIITCQPVMFSTMLLQQVRTLNKLVIKI